MIGIDRAHRVLPLHVHRGTALRALAERLLRELPRVGAHSYCPFARSRGNSSCKGNAISFPLHRGGRDQNNEGRLLDPLSPQSSVLSPSSLPTPHLVRRGERVLDTVELACLRQLLEAFVDGQQVALAVHRP